MAVPLEALPTFLQTHSEVKAVRTRVAIVG
jgi:hypothetical protein